MKNVDEKLRCPKEFTKKAMNAYEREFMNNLKFLKITWAKANLKYVETYGEMGTVEDYTINFRFPSGNIRKARFPASKESKEEMEKREKERW